MQSYYPILARSALFEGISESDYPKILSCLSTTKHQFPKDSFLYHQGDPVCSVGLLLSGAVDVLQEDYWGRRNILTRIHPSDLFAEAFAFSKTPEMGVSVLASEPSDVLFFPHQQVLAVCSSACDFHLKLVSNMLLILSEKNIRITQKLGQVTRPTTKEKLLSFLSDEALRQQQNPFTLSFSRQQLADYLSVDRSAMSTALSKMQQEGLIRYRKNRFTLTSSEED